MFHLGTKKDMFVLFFPLKKKTISAIRIEVGRKEITLNRMEAAKREVSGTLKCREPDLRLHCSRR